MLDYILGIAPQRQDAVRVATQIERPTFDPAGRSQEEELKARHGLLDTKKDGSAVSNTTIDVVAKVQ